MLVQCVISLDLSVLVEILSVVDSDHGTDQRRYKVNIMSNIKNVMLTKYALLSSHLADYLLQIGQFLLDHTSLKILLACSILWGCERQIFN